MAALRLKTAADPTGASPLGSIRAGGPGSRGIITPYGFAYAAMLEAVANPNVPTLAKAPVAPAGEVGTPEEPPQSPDVQGMVGEPPQSPNLDSPDNIIDFNAPTDYADEAGMAGGPMTDAQEADQFFAAQRVQHDEFEKRRSALQPHIDAAVNGLPAPAEAAKTAPTSPVRTSKPLSEFRSEVGTPITFKSDKGAAWNPGDEVGFNDASVEGANPGWTGGASWTPGGTMGGGYNGSVMAAPSRATPDQPHQYSEQTQHFYDRLADRARSGNRSAANRLRNL